jgi:hypothetical protein
VGSRAPRRRARGHRARYAEWEIIGPPEIRDVDPQAARFNPYRPRAKRFRHPVYEAS